MRRIFASAGTLFPVRTWLNDSTTGSAIDQNYGLRRKQASTAAKSFADA